ncbi:MAG TPA: CYTH domain-containing protein [Candidatus Merdicola faecigallinarum]|uniref:CYTH domain-containing protein n=1 Tax=Candidatus Merdicola faecigallinarum TaxID=2840862 RepID=A0A9D1M280_9FIRM|nr:CYTH domain-containing protein [Candidatus Merdicola faecigallinarum]
MKKTEYEVRVLEIDQEKLKEKLEKLGAIKQGDYNQKRYTYNFTPIQRGKWVRLRTDGTKTTLAIKDIQSKEIDGTKELEVEVSDFETTNEILNDLGYQVNNYQENKRITYELNGVEIDIDHWPLIPPYVEIEGNSEEEVLDTLKDLGLDNGKVTTLDPMGVYKEIYGIDISNKPILKFED